MVKKSKVKTYGVDLDGVSFLFVEGFLAHLNKALGLDIKPEDITRYKWYENTPVSEEDFYDQVHKFGRGGGYRHLEVIEGTVEALRSITEAGHKIVYITNRPEYALVDTVEALEEHKFPQRQNLLFAKGDKAKKLI